MINITLLFTAFAGGVLSTTTPCNLIALPTFASSTLNDVHSWKKGLFISLAYGLGFSMVFTLIGTCLLFIPGFISNQTMIQVVGGIIIICFGFFMLFGFTMKKKNAKMNLQDSPKPEEDIILGKTPEKNMDISEIPHQTSLNYVKYIIMGMSFGTSGFACVLPIFIPIISMILLEGSVLNGVPYLSFYSLGIILPYIPIGIFLGKINGFIFLKIIKYQKILNRVIGLVIIILGLFYIEKPLRLLGVL